MSERKRATHYALMDSAFSADRKFVRLARKAAIPIEFAAAVGVYWIVLADSRRAKSPTVDWSDYEEYVPQLDLLKSVGLLTNDGFPPEAFTKWAPAYKSPFDSARGTKGNTGVRNGTQGTQGNATSVQFNSVQGVGGVGEGESFMGYRPKRGAHEGQHPDCAVCAPLRPAAGASLRRMRGDRHD